MCAAQSNPTQSFGPYTWGFATDNTRADSVLEISPNINYTVSSESVSSQRKKKNLKITLNNIPYFVVIGYCHRLRARRPPTHPRLSCEILFCPCAQEQNQNRIEICLPNNTKQKCKYNT